MSTLQSRGGNLIFDRGIYFPDEYISKALYYKWLVVDLLSAFVDYDKNTINYDYIFDEFEKILKDIPYQILDKRIVDIWDSISERDIDTLYKKLTNYMTKDI